MQLAMRVSSALLVLIILISSCGKKDPSDSQAGDNFNYNPVQLEKVYGVCDQPDTSCASIKIEYPEITNAPTETATTAINHFIKEAILKTSPGKAPAQSMEELMEQFIEEYKGLLKDFPDYSIDWSSEKKMDILYQDANVLSLRFRDFSYTGGAHPMTMVSYNSFDLHLGERLQLSDLFTTGFEEKLNAIAEAKFRADKQIDSAENLNSAGFMFENDRFFLPDNFAIVEEGIAFYYNSYEIAPYAMGPTELVLKYNELKEIIPDNGLLEK